MTTRAGRPHHRASLDPTAAFLAAYAERFGVVPRVVTVYRPGGHVTDTETRPPSLVLPVAVPRVEVMNANDRHAHWGARAEATAVLRERGWFAARAVGFPRLDAPHRLVVTTWYPDKRHRDVMNLYPTVKALLDGMIDAKVLPNDDDTYLSGPWLEHALTTTRPTPVTHVPGAVFLFAFTFSPRGW